MKDSNCRERVAGFVMVSRSTITLSKNFSNLDLGSAWKQIFETDSDF
jgi:hypothetical protein